jgi:predicted unusual protein kinase regulating ubiquinone biosynthesis (AarF/ABC1/UbiB family)
MIFVDNFIHGDLHPGNILVQNCETSNRKPRNYAKEFVLKLFRSRYQLLQTKLLCNHRFVTNVPTELQSETIDTSILNYEPTLVFLNVGMTVELQDCHRHNFCSVFKVGFYFF